MEMDIEDLRRQTAEHLWNLGNLVSSFCPPVSRFHLCTLERHLNVFPELLKKKNKMNCRHCGSVWNSENCRIRILPRQHRNRHITKLQKLEAIEPWKLNKHQRRKLRKFQESRSKIVYSCFSCKKKTVFEGSKPRNNQHTSIKSTDGLCQSMFDKKKLNKKDLNAGLFIPCESNIKNSSEESVVSPHQKSISKSKTKANLVKIRTPSSSSLKFLSETSSSSQKKCTNKKKKTLLGQIENEEQNSKKRISLSSFLTSL